MNESTAIPTHNRVVLQGQPTRYIPGPTNKFSLVNKLCKIMEFVGAVPKTGHNKFHNYDYSTENDLTNAVRAALAKQGIMLIPGVESIAVELVSVRTGKGEAKDAYSTVTMSSHMLLDGDTGEQIIYQMGGHSVKTDDKGLYANFTGAQKYALQKLFLIASEESEPERDEGAAFAPDEPAKPQPSRYRTAADDPAVRQRMEREEREFQQESPQPPQRQRRGSVETAAQRGGLKAEPAAPPDDDPFTSFPAWTNVVKNCGDAHRGKTLAWVALHDAKSLKVWQKDWQPKPARPGGPVPATQAELRAALDESMADPLTPEELKEVVKLQEAA